MSDFMNIVNLLEKLFRIKSIRRKELFNQLIKPIYNEFKGINEYYLDMLDEAERCLPFKRIENSESVVWIVTEHGENKNLSKNEEKQIISSIMDKARKSNDSTDVIRELFRKKVTDLLETVSYEQERRFLFCVIAYFGSLIHEDINSFNSDKIIGTIEKRLSKKLNEQDFLNAVEDTSIGESLEDLLLETQFYEYPRQFVHNTRIWINAAYIKIGIEYQRLQKEIIESSAIT